MALKGITNLERPLQILMLGVLLAHLGTLLVMPILPIMLKTDAGLSVTKIGTVLAAIAIAFQFGSIFGGILADRIGRRFIIGLGALIAGVGIALFGFFTGYGPLLLAAIIMGLGNGLHAPSIKASIAALASEENRTTAFSLRGIAANIGTGTAGLIIFFLVTGTPSLLFWTAGLIYGALAVISWTLLPKRCGEVPCPQLPIGAYGEVFKNKPFLVFSLVSILIWALYAQLSFALPIRATTILPSPENVALIWTINSVIVVFTQRFITKRFIDRVHPLSALSGGIVFIGIGVGSLFFASSFWHLVISGAIFVIGEMLILPTTDSTISQLSKANMIGLFFAVSNVVSGLGEAGGKSLGGALLGNAEESALPWIAYALSGAVLGLLVLVLKKWEPLNVSLKHATKQKDKPKHAPHVAVEPPHHRSHPINDWVPEQFFRKKHPVK
ncbi:MFS transporter [Cytobacillus suaedae]|nr:MFS transporter [Cytobacillus suaedae]